MRRVHACLSIHELPQKSPTRIAIGIKTSYINSNRSKERRISIEPKTWHIYERELTQEFVHLHRVFVQVRYFSVCVPLGGHTSWAPTPTKSTYIETCSKLLFHSIWNILLRPMGSLRAPPWAPMAPPPWAIGPIIIQTECELRFGVRDSDAELTERHGEVIQSW